MKYPTIEEIAERVAEKTLDETLIDGKCIREWIKEIARYRWIPVSEDLPKKYGEYYITWVSSDINKPCISICECEISEFDFNHERNRFNVNWLLDDYIKAYHDVRVIAWMPLPEPYEPQESEDKE